MATIHVDGKAYEVEDGQNLLQACLSLGLDLPFFCWHPALHSVGACRQCAVKQFMGEDDTRGRIVMACMTAADDGARISIDDPEARAFRAGVIEWLMVNHPHDCPVCDEGGECHLQDMTVLTGHNYRRHRFQKRTHRDQYLGPFIKHEMNRCIACYRCVRFYRDYAGGHDLATLAIHDHVYFGRHEDGVLESEFAGNLVEVCPTGVFVDKTFHRHYTRKWDLQTAPSVCVHCSVGCNTIPGERYGTLRRIRNRYNYDVNGYFLCDRGRFGYEFVNAPRRIRAPFLRTAGGEQQPAGRDEALANAATFLQGGGRLIGIGSPRASLEANFALRSLVGAGNFYQGVSEADARLLAAVLDILRRGPARTPSLHDVSQADAVLVLGEDLNNTAPMMALALHQSVRQGPMEIPRNLGIPDWHASAVLKAVEGLRGPLFLAVPHATRLDEISSGTYQAAPGDLARLGFAVARALQPALPRVPGLPAELEDLAGAIADGLRRAKRPLVISGTSCGSLELIQAAANVAWSLGAELSLVVPECNSLGLAMMGGGSLEAAREAVQGQENVAVVVLENDLYRRMDDGAAASLLQEAAYVVAVDHLSSPTTHEANLVLPAGTFAESDGTLVNNEGRAQRFFQVLAPVGEVQESWRWLGALAAMSGRGTGGWASLDDVLAAMAQELPDLAPAVEVAPGAGFRLDKQKVARQPHRWSGRTAIVAHLTVHEPQPPADPDAPLAFSMEGYEGKPPAPLIPRFWAPNWNSVQAMIKFQEQVGGPLEGGPVGRRLVEPGEGPVTFFDEVPAAFVAREGQWLVVPLYHVFGSEEQSALAPGIAELAPAPYLGLNEDDLASLGAAEGDRVTVTVGVTRYQLPARVVPELPRGIAGLPVGLPGLPGRALGTRYARVTLVAE
ncbi:MAG: NADH-quinone oxidoreductase subunit NuoG [Anaerolineaceae bacterium]|nr:NADH-quinone oxidoreductase subunit NuoG [Anaerolineaceae bacterium]